MKEDPYDGCGISSAWATSENDPFHNACQLHDKFYSKNPSLTKVTRKEADTIFLNAMIQIAKDRKSAKLKLRAYLYYYIARTFGGLFWD